MKAILVKKDKSLVWEEVPEPICGANEVKIRIAAAGINRADLMQRNGDYPPPEGCPEWMGLEVSGTIVEKGSLVGDKRKIGQDVCALLGGGGYAEYVCVNWDMTMPVPAGIGLVEAAAMPEAYATAYLNLFIEGNAKPGETLLMNAGASGLASVVIPMAKSFGLRVITTVLTNEAAEGIKHLDADRTVVTSHEKIEEVLKDELKNGHGVDLAIDCLGGNAVTECLPYMERGGRWIMIATLAGDTASIDLKTLYKRSIRIIGNTLRARSPSMKAEILSRLVKEIWPKVENNEIRPTIYHILPIEEAQTAQALLQDGKSMGKVVLIVNHDMIHC